MKHSRTSFVHLTYRKNRLYNATILFGHWRLLLTYEMSIFYESVDVKNDVKVLRASLCGTFKYSCDIYFYAGGLKFAHTIWYMYELYMYVFYLNTTCKTEVKAEVHELLRQPSYFLQFNQQTIIFNNICRYLKLHCWSSLSDLSFNIYHNYRNKTHDK